MSVVSIQHVLIHCILLLFLSFENLLIEYLDCSQCAQWCVVHWIYMDYVICMNTLVQCGWLHSLHN